MTRSSVSALSVAILLLAGACTDQVLLQAPRVPPASSSANLERNLSEAEPRPRFHVEVRILDALVPRKPIRFRITARAFTDVKDAESRVAFPELDLEDAATGFRRAASSERGHALKSSAHTSMRAGEIRIRDTLIEFPEAGYYRIVASEIAKAANSSISEGEIWQDVNHTQQWFFVDSSGGRVTGEYQPNLISAEYRQAPGAYRRREQAVGSRRQLNQSSNTVDKPFLSSLSSPPDGTNRRLVYYNPDEAAWNGAPWVTVSWLFYDYQYGGPTNGSSTTTDSDGYFFGACPSSWEYAVGEYQLYNGRVRMGNGGQILDQYHEGGGVDCSGYYEILVPSDPAHAYKRMTEIANASASILGYSRGQVEVEIRPVSVSRYEDWTDKVILTRPTWSSGSTIGNDGIWGWYGAFSMGHEYGHAVHEKGLGGLPNSRACPSPHYLWTSDLNYGCAYSEGFAHFHAMLTVGAAFNPWYSEMIANAYYQAGTDGGVWESSVASTLWHLTHDASMNGAISPNYLASLMRDGCKVSNPDWGGLYKRPQGIDNLIYCVERLSPLDAVLQSKYFGSRNASSGITWSVAAPANSPSLTAIRAVWGMGLRGTTNITVP